MARQPRYDRDRVSAFMGKLYQPITGCSMVGRSGQGEGSQAWQGNQGMIGMIGHVMTVILARLHYQMCAHERACLKLNLFFTYLCKMVELYVCV